MVFLDPPIPAAAQSHLHLSLTVRNPEAILDLRFCTFRAAPRLVDAQFDGQGVHQAVLPPFLLAADDGARGRMGPEDSSLDQVAFRGV